MERNSEMSQSLISKEISNKLIGNIINMCDIEQNEENKCKDGGLNLIKEEIKENCNRDLVIPENSNFI